MGNKTSKKNSEELPHFVKHVFNKYYVINEYKEDFCKSSYIL